MCGGVGGGGGGVGGGALVCVCVCVWGRGVIVVQHFMKCFVCTLISPQIYGV